MSQALYRKWRPRLWEQVIGQEHIVHTLQNAIRGQRVGHAYLFAGPRGTGKTTTARLLAKAVNCLAESSVDRPCDQCIHCLAVNDGRFMDLIEIDAASNTSVDDVRDLREKINFAPSQGRYKVYIIDEVHMLSTAAFNALLKTLEEPPPHAIFILATTEVHKIPATVLSRCQRHEFRRIPVRQIVAHLKSLCEQENIQVDDEALTLIARQSTGSLRDAISLLDQLASTGNAIDLALAQQVLGTATSQAVVELIDAVLQRHPTAGFERIHAALDSGSDPRQFARQAVDYLRNLLLVKMGNAGQIEATPEQRTQMASHAQQYEMGHLLESLRLFNVAASEVRSGWQPGLQIELAFAQSIEYREASIPAAQPAAQLAPQIASPKVDQATQTGALMQTESTPQTRSEVRPKQRGVPAVKEAQQTVPSPVSQVEEPAFESEKPDAAAPDGPVSLQHILDNWEKIRQRVKSRNKPTEGLLNSCKSITMREGVLQLGFGGKVLKELMEKDDNIKITAKAIQQVIGVEVPVVCILVNTKGGPVQVDPNVDADGMVNAALNLGGKIVQKE